MTEAPDGRDLMLAVSADEAGAFDTLVRVYERRVKAAVSRSIRDRASVDDLAQEVFLRLYRARARYQPTARFETFLYRIIFNLCVNHTQYSNRRRTWSLDAPQSGADEDGAGYEPEDLTAHAPLEELELSERAQLVRKSVETLPDSQRQALVLSRFEGLGYQDIAAAMGLSLPAVKSLLWRARENLRERLQPILQAQGYPTGAIDDD